MHVRILVSCSCMDKQQSMLMYLCMVTTGKITLCIVIILVSYMWNYIIMCNMTISMIKPSWQLHDFDNHKQILLLKSYLIFQI